jgi:hypothetical protein
VPLCGIQDIAAGGITAYGDLIRSFMMHAPFEASDSINWILETLLKKRLISGSTSLMDMLHPSH